MRLRAPALGLAIVVFSTGSGDGARVAPLSSAMFGASSAVALTCLVGGTFMPDDVALHTLPRLDEARALVLAERKDDARPDDERPRYLRPATYRLHLEPTHAEVKDAHDKAAEVTAETEVDPLPPRSKLVPALGLGASLGVGVLAAVFAVRAMNALQRTPPDRAVPLSTGSSVTIPDPDYLRAQGTEAATNGLLSLLCTSGAVAGLVTSTMLLLSE